MRTIQSKQKLSLGANGFWPGSSCSQVFRSSPSRHGSLTGHSSREWLTILNHQKARPRRANGSQRTAQSLAHRGQSFCFLFASPGLGRSRNNSTRSRECDGDPTRLQAQSEERSSDPMTTRLQAFRDPLDARREWSEDHAVAVRDARSSFDGVADGEGQPVRGRRRAARRFGAAREPVQPSVLW